MLPNISVSDIDISAENVMGVVWSRTNTGDVLINAKISGYDDTELLCMVYTFKVLSIKEV